MLERAVAIALVIAGGLATLRGVAITIALPFSVVMILMCFALVRQFRIERNDTLHAELLMRRAQLAEHVTQTLHEDGLVVDNGGAASAAEPRRRLGRRRD